MRTPFAVLIISFGLISFAASANKVQLDRRQFLIGAGSVSSAAVLPGPALALAKFGGTSPLFERVQLFMTDAQFRHNVYPQWLDGHIGDFVFNSVVRDKISYFNKNLSAAEAVVRQMLTESGLSFDSSRWRPEVLAEEAAYSSTFTSWWEKAAIEVVEGELEVSRILRIPLETVQQESNYFLHLSRYVRPQDSVITPAVIDTAPLGREFLKTYLEVLGRRLPGFNTALTKSIRFYSFYDGLPDWMAEYQGHLTSLNAEAMGVEARAARPLTSVQSVAVEEETPAVIRGGSVMQQISSRVQSARQSCADLMNKFNPDKGLPVQTPPALAASETAFQNPSILDE